MAEKERDRDGDKALSFENVEDIPSIDCEDTISEDHPRKTTHSANPEREANEGMAGGKEEKDEGEMKQESSENTATLSEDTKSEDHPRKTTHSDREANPDREANEGMAGGKEEKDEGEMKQESSKNTATLSEDNQYEDTAQDKAAFSTDKADGDEISDEDQEEVPVTTHTFSFSLKTDEVPHGDSASESQTESKPMENPNAQPSAIPKASKTKSKGKKLKTLKLKEERDSDSSVSSRKKGAKGKAQVKCKFAPGGLEYIEDCLQGRFFSGWVEERRWVEHLGGYRDVVEVDEWEVDLNKQLNAIVRSIPGVLEGSKWINITPPSAVDPCYCLWVLLGEAPTPGHYWFTITGVSVQPQFGLRLSLRILRSIHPQDYETADVRQKRKQLLRSCESGQELETIGQQLLDWWEQMKQMNFSLIWSAIRTTLTPSNIKEALRFIVVLTITLAVGLATFLRDSHHMALRFIREAGIFFHNITPFLQSIMAFVEKLIGGFYLLIAMVYRDIRQPSAPPPPPLQTARQPPLALPHGEASPSHYPPGPRVVKYVPPQQWVYRSQNSSSLQS